MGGQAGSGVEHHGIADRTPLALDHAAEHRGVVVSVPPAQVGDAGRHDVEIPRVQRLLANPV